MKLRSLLVPALIAAPFALFRRKAKDGWLGELEEIRGQALGEHQEIGAAMGEPTRNPEVAAPQQPSEVVDVHDVAAGAREVADTPEPGPTIGGRTHGTIPAPDTGGDPAHETRDGDTPAPGPTIGGNLAAPGTGGHPAPAVRDGDMPVDAVAPPSAGPRPPRPAPHRQHPSQLWHAPIELSTVRMPPEVAPEERLDPADLVESTEEASASPRSSPRSGSPSGLSTGPASVTRPEGLESFDDRLALRNQHDHATSNPLDVEPPVDVLAGRDLVDAAEPIPTDGVVQRNPPGEDLETGRRRLAPPTDIFDVAPSSRQATGDGGRGDTTDPDGGVGSDDGALARGPVVRGGNRGHSRRSLFGGGQPSPLSGDPGTSGGPGPTGGTPDDGDAQTLVVSGAGELADDQGTIRLADRVRPDIVRTAAGDSFAVDAGWCWVARVRSANPARVSLPAAILVVPAGTRALAVVESDSSTFVSVVAGSAHLEHASGRMTIASGSIAHVPLRGTVTLDTASPDEMAADAILTRNLRLDDARDAIVQAKGSAPPDGSSGPGRAN